MQLSLKSRKSSSPILGETGWLRSTPSTTTPIFGDKGSTLSISTSRGMQYVQCAGGINGGKETNVSVAESAERKIPQAFSRGIFDASLKVYDRKQ
jgi:hypothetical protein